MKLHLESGSRRREEAERCRGDVVCLVTSAATRLVCLLLACSFASVVTAQPEPATPETEGRQLAARLISLRPAENTSHSGLLQIRDASGKRREIPVALTTTLTAAGWQSSYTVVGATNVKDSLVVVHTAEQPNQYFRAPQPTPASSPQTVRVEPVGGNAVMTPFAGTDFWLADLGLEFLHWPAQRVIKKEMRRGEWCHVLESVNPRPAPGAYTRVVSWIDLDTGGIIHADAYAQGKNPLKVFEPKKFQKVNGRWEVKSLEIRNEQDDTRTTLLFDVPAK